MRLGIENTVTVITGASSGIGRATALAFAAAGGTVVVAARREAALDELAQECETSGGKALAVPVDVTDGPAVEALARRAIETFGRLDTWINNAAVTLFGRFEETPIADFRRVIDTNLLSYVHGARAILPWFREQGRGVLINVSSGVGKSPSLSPPLMSSANTASSRYPIACGRSFGMCRAFMWSRCFRRRPIRPCSCRGAITWGARPSPCGRSMIRKKSPELSYPPRSRRAAR